MKYILSIDQSTSCTKALLFDGAGGLAARFDLPHRQLIDENGWVEHDPLEIWANVTGAVRGVLEKSGISPEAVAGVGLSNQRETAIAWDKTTGVPLYNAIVWQCGRGEAICKRIAAQGEAERIKRATGLNLSPYFSAAKLAWILENVPAARGAAEAGRLCCSTMDSWLLYKMTGGRAVKTDYSNASRTQLLNLNTLRWDEDICKLFGLSSAMLPEICDSNSLFGETDFGGILTRPAPILGVMGDSHGSLFAHGCLSPGMVKATYGTGSSVMMNTGDRPVFSGQLVTSLAWGLDGRVSYVLEGNLNYTGAVIKWLVDDMGLLASSKEAGSVAAQARRIDGLYLVPAFSGLGAPYWDDGARAVICGMDRGCGRAEIVRAAEESIAHQITDILRLMRDESGIPVSVMRTDGGPTRDSFLMQFQADIADVEVAVSGTEELSGMGPAYLAGMGLGMYAPDLSLNRVAAAVYTPEMEEARRAALRAGWGEAVKKALSR